MAQQYRFFHWHLEFPGIFTVPDSGVSETESTTGWQGGFSCVVGNPPWERVKIQDKEFFASTGRNDIAKATTAAIRTKMIKALEVENPAACMRYIDPRSGHPTEQSICCCTAAAIR